MSAYSDTQQYRCPDHPKRWVIVRWEGEDEGSSEPECVRRCAACEAEAEAEAELELRELGELP